MWQRRVIGVDYAHDGAAKFAAAKREVLLCAGTVNSPQLLQLSGIGSAAALSALGVDSVFDNPSVGGHLQDHLAVVYSFKATQPTLNNALHSTLGKLTAGVRYLLSRRGPLALSVNQMGGFLPLGPGDTRPAVQLYFNPVTYSTGDATRKSIEVDGFPGFYLCFQPTRPTSVGRIDIASADFRQAPVIAPNYLSTSKDEEDVIACGRLLQTIAQTRAMRSLILEPIAPDLNSMDGAAILADFRARAMTVYHPVSTPEHLAEGYALDLDRLGLRTVPDVRPVLLFGFGGAGGHPVRDVDQQFSARPKPHRPPLALDPAVE